MTEDELIEMGGFCQGILTHPLFLVLCTQFEQSTGQQILATKPHESKTRESIYLTFMGAEAFTDLMKDCVAQATAIVKKRNTELSHRDALEDNTETTDDGAIMEDDALFDGIESD